MWFRNFSKIITSYPYLSHLQKFRRRVLISSCQMSSGVPEFVPDILPDDEGPPEVFDLIVVGGGIVGITTARAILINKPTLKVAVLEKEPNIAMHQSSHNSGVIHAGIYYKPGSLKAKFCVAGLKSTYKFCDEHKIPYKKCGKLIVACNEVESFLLKKLFNNALKNGSPNVELIEHEKIQDIEPHCQGLHAIYSPETGIVNWGMFTKYCAKDFQARGGKIFCNFEVAKITETKEGSCFGDVSTNPILYFDSKYRKCLRSKYGITCAGLYSDKVAVMSSGFSEPFILPFRGEYLELVEEKRYLVRGNIYPVPNPNLPFLGVHFTPQLDGNVIVGPNAVPALGRESYSWNIINKEELWEIIKFRGFRLLAYQYSDYGFREIMKSFVKSMQVEELRKYIPELKANDIQYKGFCGVRAQAIDNSGDIIDDLIIHLGSEGIEGRIMHVRNAPSPAATSSLPFAEYLAKSALVEFDI